MKKKLITLLSLLLSVPVVFAHEVEGMMEHHDSMWWFLWINPMTIITSIVIIALLIIIFWLLKNK